MIDAHVQYQRAEWRAALWSPEARRASALWARLSLRGGLLADDGALVAALAARGLDGAVVVPDLSIAPGPQMPGGPAAALALCRTMNDATADLVARHPGVLTGLAVANPLGGAADLDEARRAVLALGLRGIAVGSSYRGIGPAAPAARPLLALVEALGVPLVIHPTVESAWQPERDFGLDLLLGAPTGLAGVAVRLVASGRLAEFPRLRIVLTHLGGAFLALLGWIDAQTAGDDTPFSLVAQRFWVDTATATPGALALAVQALGVEQVLFGTDWPLAPPARPGDPQADVAAMLSRLPIGPEGRALILGGNARALFG